jgi:hypothetical protein
VDLIGSLFLFFLFVLIGKRKGMNWSCKEEGKNKEKYMVFKDYVNSNIRRRRKEREKKRRK